MSKGRGCAGERSKKYGEAGECVVYGGRLGRRSNLGLSLSFAQQRDTRYGDTRYKIQDIETEASVRFFAYLVSLYLVSCISPKNCNLSTKRHKKIKYVRDSEPTPRPFALLRGELVKLHSAPCGATDQKFCSCLQFERRPHPKHNTNKKDQDASLDPFCWHGVRDSNPRPTGS